MISCRSLAGCLRKIRDKGLMKHPHSREDAKKNKPWLQLLPATAWFSCFLHFTRAAPTAVRPGHGRKSSSCRCNHLHELAHIQFLPLSTHSLSAPRSPHKMQGDAAHRPPGGSHASAGFVLVPPNFVFCSISFRCGGLSIERNQKPLTPENTLALAHHDKQKQVEVKRSSRANPHEIRLFSGCPYAVVKQGTKKITKK